MIYYPQAAVILDILWEDFGQGAAIINKDHPLVVQPKDLSVTINSHKEADTCRFVVDYKNFPFEPRLIRAMKVTVSLSNQEKIFDKSGSTSFLAPQDVTTLSAAAKVQFDKQLKESTVFAGFADESEIMFNDGSREVTVECRDQTALLIDRKFPRTALDLNKSLALLVREILDSSESTKPLQVEFRPATLQGDLRNISAASGDLAVSKKSIKAGESAWDVINDLCRRVAVSPFIELDKLIITKPRLLFKDSRRRVLTWGTNVTDLSVKRKLGRDKGINVQVRAFDQKNKRTVFAEYPKDRSGGVRQKIKKIVNGEVQEEDAPVHVFFHPPGSWEDGTGVMLDRAEEIWNEMARQELEGSLSTKEMVLCDKDGTKYKTMDIKMGTPVEIHVTPEDAKTLDTLQGRGRGDMVKYLVSRCYKPQVAQALAASYELNRRFATVFYTKSVQYTMNHSQGFSAKVDFINFVELDPGLTQNFVAKVLGG